DRVPGLERDLVRPELGEVPAHLDTVALAQPLLRDRAGGDAYRRLARRRAPAAAVVAQPVFLPVRVIRVSGAGGVGEGRVVFRAVVFVADQKADRGAGGLAFEHAGQDLDAVGFHALGHVARAAGLPAVQLLLYVGFGEREPRRAAVDDAAVRRPVALPERRHAIQQPEGVARHDPSPEIPSEFSIGVTANPLMPWRKTTRTRSKAPAA